MEEVLSRTVRLLEGKAHEKNMSILVQDLGTFPAIVADEKDMEQMCFALIENAIQATDGRSRHQLVISAERTPAQICLRFEDDCGGIAPEHADKIFQPFFTTKPPNEGTGLGLCIVERIVGQVRGKVRVENAPGRGAAFCVALPLKDS
jgi:C4-dicarboxylate-specific signal transduction histidine kinase